MEILLMLMPLLIKFATWYLDGMQTKEERVEIEKRNELDEAMVSGNLNRVAALLSGLRSSQT